MSVVNMVDAQCCNGWRSSVASLSHRASTFVYCTTHVKPRPHQRQCRQKRRPCRRNRRHCRWCGRDLTQRIARVCLRQLILVLSVVSALSVARWSATSAADAVDGTTVKRARSAAWNVVNVKPRPHPQQWRSNVVEYYTVECCFDIVAVFGSNVERPFVKFGPFETKNWTCLICLDIVERTKFRSTLLTNGNNVEASLTLSNQQSTLSKKSFDLWHSTMLLRQCCS